MRREPDDVVVRTSRATSAASSGQASRGLSSGPPRRAFGLERRPGDRWDALSAERSQHAHAEFCTRSRHVRAISTNDVTSRDPHSRRGARTCPALAVNCRSGDSSAAVRYRVVFFGALPADDPQGGSRQLTRSATGRTIQLHACRRGRRSMKMPRADARRRCAAGANVNK